MKTTASIFTAGHRQCDYLVTTDLDLLVLEGIGATKIVRAGTLWRILFE